MLRCDKIYCSKESHTVAIDSNLKSNQEGAGTKVILHFLDALKEPETTVVLGSHSGDTNIMVLAVALIKSDCERLYIDYGNEKNRKTICLADILMNENEKDALFGFHAFSGNDYISGFFRKGQSSGSKCMMKTGFQQREIYGENKFEFQNNGKIHNFEQRKIDTANKEDFSGRFQKIRSTCYKYNKF